MNLNTISLPWYARPTNTREREKKITVLKASKWNKIESTLIKTKNSETPNSHRS
jgi:hypothetical protein